MPRLIVVGGGISGLAAAWSARAAARDAGLDLEIVVLERNAEVGGKAHSVSRDGWLVEEGPSGFLPGRPEFDALVRAAGMDSEVVTAGHEGERRFVYLGARMREFRPSPIALVRNGLLGVGGALRMASEPLVRRRHARPGDDESVWAFAARRLGRQAADRLVAPICLGVFAGDATRLSLASAFPRVATMERDHGGLVRGLIARRGRIANGALSSFQRGMQSLPRALAERGDFAVFRNADVRSVRRVGSEWVVSTAAAAWRGDSVVLAVEPWVAAHLVAPLHAPAADALAAIACPPVAVVALGFGPEARARIPVGFGVLIARGEGFRMLGNLWESSLFAGRGPDGGILVRVMLGGAVDPGIGSLTDDEVAGLAMEEIRRLYALDVAPVLTHIARMSRAIPQYECGHAERVAIVEAGERALPGLAVTGNGLRGVAFTDAATDGVRVGRRMVCALMSRHCQVAPR